MCIFLRVRKEKIGWFRFILEGYDGLALLSTLSVRDGLVQLWFPEQSLEQVFALLGAIAPKLNPINQISPFPSPLNTHCV